MSVISIEGFFDTHIHSAPAPFVRIADTIDIALWCAAGGMGYSIALGETTVQARVTRV